MHPGMRVGSLWALLRADGGRLTVDDGLRSAVSPSAAIIAQNTSGVKTRHWARSMEVIYRRFI